MFLGWSGRRPSSSSTAGTGTGAPVFVIEIVRLLACVSLLWNSVYVQELVEWAPAEVERLWPLSRAEVERKVSEIHAAFQEALDSGSLSPEQAQYAENGLKASRWLVELADEYI
jgi:hypothetical protein